MKPNEIWNDAFQASAEVLDSFRKNPENMRACESLTKLLIETYQTNHNLFICGNGGSHCDSMHFAEELTGRFRKDRRPLGALALGDASHVTCVSNDAGFEYIFERQLRGLGKTGDLLVCLSTSGNSPNVIRAAQAAKEMGIKTVGLLGKDGGKLGKLVDLPIVIPHPLSDRIQEMHIKIIHTAIETLERALFPENY